jgi:glutathione reductase (NADPH)
MEAFDLIVLGAGSGGIAASRYAASFGARVAICEEDRVGGTCVIRGCIPKKLLMYAAQFSESFADARHFGWEVGPTSFSLGAMKAAKDRETQRLEKIYRGMLDSSGVAQLRGRATIRDAHTVDVAGQAYRAERILIATGSLPAQPAVPGLRHAITSNELLDLDTLPKRLLILGSGYVAVEFGSIFAALGVDVTLAYRGQRPLTGFDDDIRARFAVALAARGITLRPGFTPSGLDRKDERIFCRSTDGEDVATDIVVNAMGRRPNTMSLQLANVGVAQGVRGEILVDRQSRSSVDSIFAIGDVTDRRPLTPVAIAEARAFVQSEFGGHERTVSYDNVASAVFSLPPVACVGLSEADARRHDRPVQIFESDFRPSKNAVSGRAERSYMKLVVDAETDVVLGAHMLGVDAPEIIQSLAVCIHTGITKAQIDSTMAVHPTAAEEFVLMRSPRRNS